MHTSLPKSPLSKKKERYFSFWVSNFKSTFCQSLYRILTAHCWDWLAFLMLPFWPLQSLTIFTTPWAMHYGNGNERTSNDGLFHFSAKLVFTKLPLRTHLLMEIRLHLCLYLKFRLFEVKEIIKNFKSLSNWIKRKEKASSRFKYIEKWQTEV